MNITAVAVSAALLAALAALSLRRWARMAEAEAEKRVRDILEGMPIACFLIDENMLAFECNHTAVKLFAHRSNDAHVDDFEPDCAGLDSCGKCRPCKKLARGCAVRKHLIRNTAALIFGKEEAGRAAQWVREKCDEAGRAGRAAFEHEHRTLHGDAVPCAVTIAPVMYGKKPCFSVYIQDLRATKKMIDEMRLRQLAEEESLAKTRFLARMSHEIRTPLNAVLGTAQLELAKGAHPPETRAAFGRIQNSSTMLLAIINDILDISKVESGTLELDLEAYGMDDFVTEVLQINHASITDPAFDFSLSIDPCLPARPVGDVLRLKQVLNNLLSNAFKYTKEGEVSLAISAEPAGIRYVVSDSGQGMTQEQIDNLFDEFARFNKEQNRLVEGVGLGMPIVQQLVRMMEGEIDVRSRPGTGTEVTVTIPQGAQGDRTLGGEKARELMSMDLLRSGARRKEEEGGAGRPVFLPHARVMVVDDVETNLDLMDGILSMYGISAELAPSGLAALEKVRRGCEYDVIFMDHMMPELDGIETTRLLRLRGYKKPIAALTANALVSNRDTFIQSGFTEFMSKPVMLDELERLLLRFVPSEARSPRRE